MSESQHDSPIPRANLTEEIVTRIISLITDLAMQPGDKLPTERELVARFGVGRSSIREAVKILNALGIVRIVAGAGMFVGTGNLSLLAKPLSLGFLRDGRSASELIEARRLLEVELAGLAAERANPEEVASIKDHLAEMRLHRADVERYTESDMRFHLAVARGAHNEVLLDLLETLQHIIRKWMFKSIEEVEGMPSSIDEHVPIHDTIAAHDSGGARAAMNDHLEKAGRRLQQTSAGTGSGPFTSEDAVPIEQVQTPRQKA
jgi:GntR family transcriptional regulator, transcriptional repressor for pyruvate dehydrogenase complex